MDIPHSQKITNPNFIQYLTRSILISWNYRGDPQFPCPQPVSIERKNFEKLKMYDYLVGVKNDGIRYIMFFTRDKRNRKLCILCDRSLNYYMVDIKGDDTLYNDTLFDGELVYSNGIYSFIVYDSVSLCGNKINKNNFESRLAEIDCCIRTLIKPNDTNSINIETKTFYRYTDFSSFLTHYNNEKNTDGIIFMPNKLPVLTGTQFSMFKWKPEHTVDFLIRFKENKDLSAFVYNKGELVHFANIIYEQVEGEKFIDKFYTLKNVKNECILECLYNKNLQNFTPLLVRTDKNYPNSLRTVERTLFNAQEDIQIEEFTKNK
jgi:hypothetical protein